MANINGKEIYFGIVGQVGSGGNVGVNIATLQFTAAGVDTIGTAEMTMLGTVDMMQYEWEQGTGNPDTGVMDVASTTRIRCQTYIDIPDSTLPIKKITVNALSASGEELLTTAYYYSSGGAFINGEVWQESGAIRAIPAGAETCRILLRHQNNSATITPSELQSCEVTFY